jgi:hypothetical protein
MPPNQIIHSAPRAAPRQPAGERDAATARIGTVQRRAQLIATSVPYRSRSWVVFTDVCPGAPRVMAHPELRPRVPSPSGSRRRADVPAASSCWAWQWMDPADIQSTREPHHQTRPVVGKVSLGARASSALSVDWARVKVAAAGTRARDRVEWRPGVAGRSRAHAARSAQRGMAWPAQQRAGPRSTTGASRGQTRRRQPLASAGATRTCVLLWP